MTKSLINLYLSYMELTCSNREENKKEFSYLYAPSYLGTELSCNGRLYRPKKNRFLGRNSKSEHAENPTPLSEKNKNGYKRPELRV